MPVSGSKRSHPKYLPKQSATIASADVAAYPKHMQVRAPWIMVVCVMMIVGMAMLMVGIMTFFQQNRTRTGFLFGKNSCP